MPKGLAKAKPQSWSIHPVLTNPEWFDYWNNGLVLYFGMMEGGGSTVRDLSGYRNNGALVADAGAAPVWGRGRYGQEVVMANNTDATTGYLEVPDSPSLTCANGITVEALWKHDTKSSNHVIARKRDGASDTYQLFVNVSGNVVFLADKGSSAGQTGTSDVIDGEWHHIVGRWSNSDNLSQIWVDGIKEDEDSEGGTMDDTASTVQILGATRNATAFDAGGTMSYLRIWERGLSQNQLLKLYANPHGMLEMDTSIFEQGRAPDAAGGRIMASLVGAGGLAGAGGIAGRGGGLAG